jgi:hypothetical protein
VELVKGRYPFESTFSDRTGQSGLVLQWKGPGMSTFQVIPESAFRDSLVDPDVQYLGCVTPKIPAAGNGRIKNWHGICLDAPTRNRRGGAVRMWSCNTKNKNQQWTYDASTGLIKARHGICLEAKERDVVGGKVHMWTCQSNNKNQQWRYEVSTGQIKNIHGGLCLHTSARSSRRGKVQLNTCDTNDQNQQWKLNTDHTSGGRTRVPLSVQKKVNKRIRQTMTLDTCQHLCSQYTYFATTKGKQCWCGNEYGLSGPMSQSCDVPCTGNLDQICGGARSHSV